SSPSPSSPSMSRPSSSSTSCCASPRSRPGSATITACACPTSHPPSYPPWPKRSAAPSRPAGFHPAGRPATTPSASPDAAVDVAPLGSEGPGAGPETVELRASALHSPVGGQLGPSTAEPGSRVLLTLWFQPTAIGGFYQLLRIEAGEATLVLRLEGEGRAKPKRPKPSCTLRADRKELVFTRFSEPPPIPVKNQVRIYNRGDEDCLVSKVRLEGDPPFKWTSPRWAKRSGCLPG